MSRLEFDEGVTPSLHDVLSRLIDGGRVERIARAQRLASLWANYGSIWRIHVETATKDATDVPASMILKLIAPPASKEKLTASDEGHLRKLLSYRVESNFYSQVYPSLSDTQSCPCAPFVGAFQQQGFVEGQGGKEALLIGDLAQDFPVFGERRGTLDATQTRTALSWLANFHAAAWQYKGPLCPTPERYRKEGWKADPADGQRRGVWERGGYSYLATRKAELARIDPGSYWGRAGLGGNLAYAVDHALSRPDQPGLTLTQGDCKAANMAFTRDGRRMAAFDFQYVGAGLGALDLAKFLTTSIEQEELEEDGGEEELLRHYWTECCDSLRLRGKGSPQDHGWTWEVFWRQWELSLIDWVRFQAGWGFWGHVEWLEARATEILERPGLRQGLISEWRS